MLTIEHLTYLAQLAKLDISSETLKKFNDEYRDISHYIEKLVQVETTNIPALYNPTTVMQDNKRNDIPIPTPNPRDLLINSPEANEKFFVVPRIV